MTKNQNKEQRLNPYFAAISFLFLFLLTQVIAGALLSSVGFDLSTDSNSVKNILVLCLFEAISLLVGIAAFSAVRKSYSVTLTFWNQDTVKSFFTLAPAGALIILPSLLSDTFHGSPVISNQLSLTQSASFILFATLVALTEELWFRGIIISVLGEEEHLFRAIIVSSLLFGLPHILGGLNSASILNALAVTLAVGIPFACVRVRYRNLASLIAWHALIDTWAFLHTARMSAEGVVSPSELALSLIPPLIIGLLYLKWVSKKQALPE